LLQRVKLETNGGPTDRFCARAGYADTGARIKTVSPNFPSSTCYSADVFWVVLK